MTILIAEDDSISSLVLQRAVRSLAEKVLVADDGEAAWRLLQAHEDVSIVISDWMMPGVDGIELCRRLRTLSGRPYTYFILLTARNFREDRLAGLAAGADDFLTKPLDRAELTARLNIARRLLSAQAELRTRTVELERMHADLTRQNQFLADLATTDGLTGLRNHRYFRESLRSGLLFAARQGLPLSLIMLDVDQFKSYNDSFGHPAGDEVLREIGTILRENVRSHDVVARYGGEEFAMLMPATDDLGSRAIGERIRLMIAEHRWPNRPVTASLGVATIDPPVSADSEILVPADLALYHSKATGRNRVTHDLDLKAIPLPG